MAIRYGLSAYRFELKQRMGQSWWTFERGSQTDGFKSVHDYLKSRKDKLTRIGERANDGTYVDKRAISLKHFVTNESAGMLAGLLVKGECGSKLAVTDFDVDNGQPVYEIKINEGVLIPLYFRLHILEKQNFGVAILQTRGIDGVKGYLDDDLRNYFSKSVVNPLTHRLVQLVDAKVLAAFAESGALQEVVLVNKGKTIASRAAMEEHTIGGEQLGGDGDRMELTIRRGNGWKAKTLNKLLNITKQRSTIDELVDSPGMQSPDDMIVRVRRGEQVQTFSLLNPDDSPIRYDITNTITLGRDGHPTWDSLHKAADGVWTNVSELIKQKG